MPRVRTARARREKTLPPRVGGVRPSQMMYAFGVGALVDLPNFSVIVGGLDDWDTTNAEELVEDRLLASVRQVHPQVQRLHAAPWIEETRSPFDDWAKVGVPVFPFPRWLRCSACDRLASVDSGVFSLRRGWFPDQTRYEHEHCSRARGRAPTAVPARFVVACPNGHIDDFPWVEFVHRDSGFACPKDRPSLVAFDIGTGARSTDMKVECKSCGQSGSMRQVFGGGSNRVLPHCRGRHAHLRRFDEDGCDKQMRAMLLGASNAWFPLKRTALSIPAAGDELGQLLAELWPKIEGSSTPIEDERDLRLVMEHSDPLAPLRRFDVAELWAAIVARREGTAAGPDEEDLLTPEWRVFAHPEGADQGRDFSLGIAASVPRYAGVAEVVPVERIREVVALVGFSRIDAPDSGVEDDLTAVTPAPLSRAEPTWVPAAEVRGEGIFIRLDEERVAAWEDSSAVVQGLEDLRVAVQEWRERRGLDPATGWLGARYVLLHSLAHALINELALECGYAAASIRERIYARDGEDAMAGVLLYTAAPDAEGTLGGLVALAEPVTFGRLLDQTLRGARLCSTDPMCAGHGPSQRENVLHRAACHACLFVPETSCERGNRLLDRAVLAETLAQPEMAYPFAG